MSVLIEEAFSPPELPIDGNATARVAVQKVLERFGADALACMRAAGICITVLRSGETYAARSAWLRRLGIDVDKFPVPPAGMFVVEERTVYLRCTSDMTIAHECGHGLDFALGDGTYRSSSDQTVRAAFASVRKFVTPYAASGIDEYVAETFRAWVEMNDANSPWPKATRARLHDVDPVMAQWCTDIFEVELPARRLASTSN